MKFAIKWRKFYFHQLHTFFLDEFNAAIFYHIRCIRADVSGLVARSGSAERRTVRFMAPFLSQVFHLVQNKLKFEDRALRILSHVENMLNYTPFSKTD